MCVCVWVCVLIATAIDSIVFSINIIQLFMTPKMTYDLQATVDFRHMVEQTSLPWKPLWMLFR